MKEDRFDKEEKSPKKKKKDYSSRRDVKSKLRNWQDEDWEELGSDYLEGDNNARNDRE